MPRATMNQVAVSCVFSDQRLTKSTTWSRVSWAVHWPFRSPQVFFELDVFTHQLGQDLVLLLDLGLQGLDLLLLGGLLAAVGGSGFKDDGALLEELLLPLVEEGRLNAGLLADVRDGRLFDEVLTKNSQFLGPGEVATLNHGRMLHMAPGVYITPMTLFSDSGRSRTLRDAGFRSFRFTQMIATWTSILFP